MVKLDTSSKPYRLEDGVKVPIAVDLVSGETYKKIASSMPFGRRSVKELKAGHPLLVLAGDGDPEDLHQEHCDDEWFRGVWQLVEDPGEVESDPVEADPNEVPQHVGTTGAEARAARKQAAAKKRKKVK
jgi:hypothetical protein